MHKLQTLKNGLTLITIDLPHLESVTTLIAVGAGSRYENKQNSGISHFLEHMFFKGSKKYPSTEQIATLVDSIGAVNNAATSKEFTYYYVKSAAKHLELAADVLSSMIKEPLLEEEEIEKEKGVIIEELRMYKDHPAHYVHELFDLLQYGDQPLGWGIGGEEKTVNSFTRQDFLDYIQALYSPKNMALVFAGKLPDNIVELAEKYFLDLPDNSISDFPKFIKPEQLKPKVDIFYKDSDQANLVFGVASVDRYSPLRPVARVMSSVLGDGMSSRLFLEIREKRGLVYTIHASPDVYKDAGSFSIYAGMKLEKVEEGVQVIKEQVEKLKTELVGEEELKKAKESIRGRLALRTESTNFLAERFGIEYVLDQEIETFEDYLAKIDAVTAEDIQQLAQEIFKPENYNLQIIAPLNDPTPFEKILSQ